MGFFYVHYIFEGAIHPCYRDFAFNPFNIDLSLVKFVFDPHFVELNFGFRKMETSLAADAYKATITGSPPSLNTTCTATTSRCSSAKASFASS